MKPALSFRQPTTPESWQKLPNGQLILAAINKELGRWLPKVFGYHLLKLGDLSNEVDCSLSPIKNHLSVSGAIKNANIVADVDDLPFLEHSVDLCVLAHALEFSLDPHHVVREANRVLIPNGYLVITGYNPFSLAGVNKLIPYRRGQQPWCERFFSPMRVKDWLHLMGYEIQVDKRVLHNSLAAEVTENKMASMYQKFAENYLPSFGSIYIIIAKKRVHPLTPIKPKWKVSPKFSTVKVPSLKVSQDREKT